DDEGDLRDPPVLPLAMLFAGTLYEVAKIASRGKAAQAGAALPGLLVGLGSFAGGFVLGTIVNESVRIGPNNLRISDILADAFFTHFHEPYNYTPYGPPTTTDGRPPWGWGPKW
ncbi:MAG: hypothetical protein KDA60_10305, partial [Planctomycetales bacterium]|nr:hypothetical protein [Planctomycetales bacterium]